MANHIDQTLRLERANEKAQAIWDAKVAKLGEISKGGYEANMAYLKWNEGDEVTINDMCDHFGAKWALANSWDENYISICSAWSPVGMFALNLIDELLEVDEDAMISLSYEDEFINFIGVSTYSIDGEINEELEWSEFMEWACDKEEDLKDTWDEEDGEFTDDGDLFSDLRYHLTEQYLDDARSMLIE